MPEPAKEASRPAQQAGPDAAAQPATSRLAAAARDTGSSESAALGVVANTGQGFKRALLIAVGILLGGLALAGGIGTALGLASQPRHMVQPRLLAKLGTKTGDLIEPMVTLHAPKSLLGVRLGHVEWRDISAQAREASARAGHSGTWAFGTTMAGDLDGDGTDELIISGSHGFKQILRLDGTPCGAYPQAAGEPLCLWDSNGDGTPEIIRRQGDNALDAADMQGKLVAKLPYRPIGASNWGSYPLIGDADGDGKPELWLRAPGTAEGGIVALSPTGKVVVSAQQITSIDQAVVCDSNGTGHQVCAVTDFRGKLQLVGADGVQDHGYVSSELRLTGSQDMDGDKLPELLCGEIGYLYHVERGLHSYRPPSDFRPPASSPDNYLPFDINGDGVTEQVYLGPDMNDTGRNPGRVALARLRAYSPQTGTVLYDEVLDRASPLGFARARAKGKDYLVVAEGDKLLIFP